MPGFTQHARRTLAALTLAALASGMPAMAAEEAGAEPALDAELDAELDALLDVGSPSEPGGSGLRWSGHADLSAAYTLPAPDHWSHLRARAEVTGSGELAPRVRWKLTARAEADGAFDLEDGRYRPRYAVTSARFPAARGVRGRRPRRLGVPLRAPADQSGGRWSASSLPT